MLKVAQELPKMMKTKLEGFLFHLDLPKIHRDTSLAVSSRIYLLGGKITFGISAQTIIVLEEIHGDELNKMLKRYEGLTKAFIIQNDCLRVIKNELIVQTDQDISSNIKGGKEETHEITAKNYEEIFMKLKEDGLKIIKLADLEKLMTRFERNSIEYHYSLGLPKSADLKGTISIVTPSHIKKKEMLHYHSFACKVKDDKKYFDIPKFQKTAPHHFSLFATKEEMRQIHHHFNKVGKYNIKKKSSTDSEIIDEPPLPHKSNKYCNLCGIQYENYLEHIKSEIHYKFRSNCEIFYDNIKKTFRSIRSFWGIQIEEQEDQKIQQKSDIYKYKRATRCNSPEEFKGYSLNTSKNSPENEELNPELRKKSTDGDVTTPTSPASIKPPNEIENRLKEISAQNNHENMIMSFTLYENNINTDFKNKEANDFSGIGFQTNKVDRQPNISYISHLNSSNMKYPLNVVSPQSPKSVISSSLDTKNNLLKNKKVIFKVIKEDAQYVNIKRHREDYYDYSSSLSRKHSNLERTPSKKLFQVYSPRSCSDSKDKKIQEEFVGPTPKKRSKKIKSNTNHKNYYSNKTIRKSLIKNDSRIKIIIPKSILKDSPTEYSSEQKSLTSEDDLNFDAPRHLTRSKMSNTIKKDKDFRCFYKSIIKEDKRLILSNKKKTNSN